MIYPMHNNNDSMYQERGVDPNYVFIFLFMKVLIFYRSWTPRMTP